ncbi:hypothetical protein C8T65DRAFT_585428, partial [Cerioporus squamosus]
MDIKRRNKAIDVVWLKEYLDLSQRRPKWAYVADALLARAILQTDANVEPRARINKFLQTWDVSMQRARKLPEDLRRMLKAAASYGVRVEARNPAKVLKLAMPIWYHLGKTEGNSVANSVAARCLRDNHKVVTVMDAVVVVRGRMMTNVVHRQKSNCKCGMCEGDRRMGCKNPQRCVEAAKKLTEKLHPMWNPNINEPGDNLSLTRRRVAANATARCTDGRILFDPSIGSNEELTDLLRIFTGPDEVTRNPVRRPLTNFEVVMEEVEVYTDGATTLNGTASAKAGSGVWFGEGDPRNMAARTAGPQTNQVAELYAINLAVAIVPPFAPLHVVTD